MKIKSRLFLLLIIISSANLLVSARSYGALAIPSGLTNAEQQLVLQILGFPTSFKPVNNPHPLGGYSGLEVGLSFESIPTGDVGYFGADASVDRNVIYPKITLGKGVLSSFDLFLSVSPYNQSTGLGIYSGAIRWGFYQATFVPATFSVLVSANNSDFGNIFNSQTEGLDLVGGINVHPFSFYIGAGALYGQGQFSPSVTFDGTSSNVVGHSFHTMLGADFSMSYFFSALELDVYSSTVAALKIGVRL